jgi:phosphatidylglycerophosphate synthase
VATSALLTSVLVLGAVDATVGLETAGRVVGLLGAVTVSGILAGAVSRHRTTVLGPADRVTLARAGLSCAVAALTADSFHGGGATTALVAVAVVALLLDWVDGRVARRTGTASTFGAAFDMEVDAFLVLVLSVDVARTAGAWVLLIGGARYALLVAARLLPWLRRSGPSRYWAKVVAATQGVVLVVAASHLLSPRVVDAALVGALGLLAESFGHQVWWLWCHRERQAHGVLVGPGPAS